MVQGGVQSIASLLRAFGPMISGLIFSLSLLIHFPNLLLFLISIGYFTCFLFMFFFFNSNDKLICNIGREKYDQLYGDRNNSNGVEIDLDLITPVIVIETFQYNNNINNINNNNNNNNINNINNNFNFNLNNNIIDSNINLNNNLNFNNNININNSNNLINININNSLINKI